MARIIDGPEITGQVVHKQTGQAYGPVTVTVSPKVYTDREMTVSVTSLTTDGQGVFSCYAQPGMYTFTTTAVDSGPIEPVEVLGHELGTNTPGSAASPVTYPSGSLATTVPRPQFIDVRDYGTWDLSSDMAAVIQAALNAAPTTGTGNDWPATKVLLPPGYIKIATNLGLPANVELFGHGATSTYLVLQTTTQSGVKLKTGTETNTLVHDLGFIGLNTATAGAAYDLSNSAGAASILGDSRHVLRDVVIVSGFDGVKLSGTNMTEFRAHSVTVQRPNRTGFKMNAATDAFLTACTAGQAGQTTASAWGFDIDGANHRVVGCKAYGGVDGNASGGFNIAGSGRNELSGCEAQDTPGTGFLIQSSLNTLTGCTADSCKSNGFQLTSAYGCTLVGVIALKRSGGTFTTQYGYRLQDSHYTMIVGAAGGPFGAGPVILTSGSDRNDIRIGRGATTTTYAAAVTPDPWDTEQVKITLTGNIAINNPTDYTAGANAGFEEGHRLRFRLIQDATGGRTVTFGAAYKTTGAIDTTASKATFITFESDGAGSWYETARSAI